MVCKGVVRRKFLHCARVKCPRIQQPFQLHHIKLDTSRPVHSKKKSVVSIVDVSLPFWYNENVNSLYQNVSDKSIENQRVVCCSCRLQPSPPPLNCRFRFNTLYTSTRHDDTCNLNPIDNEYYIIIAYTNNLYRAVYCVLSALRGS